MSEPPSKPTPDSSDHVPHLEWNPPSSPLQKSAEPLAYATPGPGSPVGGPLSHEQLEELQRAKLRGKKIQRAIGVARFDGGVTAIFAVLCIFSYCMGWENLVLGIAFGVIAWNSFRGAAKMKKYDLAAPGILGMNQIYLAAAIVLYGLYELWLIKTGRSALVEALAGNSAAGSDMGDMVGEFEKPYRDSMILWVCVVYWGVIVGTLLFQGMTAIYYFTRRRLLDDYLRQTPHWILDILRRTGG